MNIDLTTRRITSWPASERPRERILKHGGDALSSAELLAICLGSGVAGEDAVGMARRLLAEFGGLDALLSARVAALVAVRGVGPAKAAQLQAIRALSIRGAEERLATGAQCFADFREVARYVQQRIGHRQSEVFAGLYLDSRLRLLSWDELFYGSVDRTHVHAREVLKRGMEVNAAALVLAHNHPSGVVEPSQTDLVVTRELRDLLGKVDIRVVDHIIVGRGASVSLASRGLL